MSRNNLLIIFIIFFILQNGAIDAQIGGTSTYTFLELPCSARDGALGGTTIAIRDNDLSLTLNNPSLINSNLDNHIVFNYVNYISDINYGYVAYSKTFNQIGSFVAGMQYVNYGKFTEADPTGLITGSFSAADYSFNIGYGRQIDSNFSIGATLKTIYSQLDQYVSVGSALDLAATYNNDAHLYTAALIVKGIGYQWVTYINGNQEPLPFQIQLGITKKFKHAPIRVGLTYNHIEKWNLSYTDSVTLASSVDPITNQPIKQSSLNTFIDNLGRHIVGSAEVYLGKNITIRMGYNYERREELRLAGYGGLPGFSFGLGLKISKFNISYGYAQYSVAGASNLFSIATNLADYYKKNEKSDNYSH